MDSDIGKTTDRISKLPDAVLCHILSFLPTKQSVATSVLSKRWENLWAFVPTLEFDDSDLFQPYDKEQENKYMLKFMNFVNRVLLLSDVQCLEKFSLSLESFCNFDLVDTWLATAIKRNAKTLEIGYHMEDLSFIDDPVPLPQRIFTSKTLVRLDLSGLVLLDVRSPVWLPSLKFLELLDILYASDDSVKKLLHGCPSLEELALEMWVWRGQFIPNLFSISVPTLKSLSITRFIDEDPSDEEFSDQFYKLEINAPELEHLSLCDYFTDEFSFADFSSLLTADIQIGPPSTRLVGSSDCDSRIYQILSAVANVKSLKFASSAIDYALPSFHNLTNLELRSDVECTWNLNMLKGFLEYSANLEVLILEGEVQLGSSEVLSLPPDVPHCLRLHLKKVEISTIERKEYELKMIKYLLKNACVLKEMTVHCRRRDGCICSDLAKYPRGSKKCKLNLIH